MRKCNISLRSLCGLMPLVYIYSFTLWSSEIWHRTVWYMPDTTVAWSKVCTVFARSEAGIVGSNPTQGMHVCVRLFCVCIVLCVGSGLAMGWAPVPGVLPTANKWLQNWITGLGPEWAGEPLKNKTVSSMDTIRGSCSLLFTLSLFACSSYSPTLHPIYSYQNIRPVIPEDTEHVI
jgi:hypothetical protein